MTDRVDLKVHGIADAMKALKTLEFKAKRRVVQSACRAGGRVLLKEARQKAPVRTGEFKKKLAMGVRTDRRKGIVKATIRGRKQVLIRKGSGVMYDLAYLITRGTKPHGIPRELGKKGYALAVKIDGVPYRQVHHPGSPANPFLESAARVAGQRSIDAFSKKFGELLEKEAAKLR